MRDRRAFEEREEREACETGEDGNEKRRGQGSQGAWRAAAAGIATVAGVHALIFVLIGCSLKLILRRYLRSMRPDSTAHANYQQSLQCTTQCIPGRSTG